MEVSLANKQGNLITVAIYQANCHAGATRSRVLVELAIYN